MSNEAKAPIPAPVPPEDPEEEFKRAKEKVALFRNFIREGRSVKEARLLAGLIPFAEPETRAKA